MLQESFVPPRATSLLGRIRGAIESHSHAVKGFLVLAGLTPIVLVAWYVVTYGSLAPIGDEWWDTVYIAVKTKAGILKLEDLLVRTAGHRVAVIRLVAALSTKLTDYDAGLLRFATFVTTLANLGLVTLLLKRCGRGLMPAGFFLFAAILFTLYHEGSWLDMYQSQWQQPLFFVLLGLTVLQRMPPGWSVFALLIVCAIAASLSQAAGIVAWISFPAAAIGIPAYRHKQFVILWPAALIAFAIFYYSNYAVDWQNNDVPVLGRILDDPKHAVVFLIRFQAVRFLPNQFNINLFTLIFTLISLLVLVANLWQMIHKRERENEAAAALWGSLALFSLSVAAVVFLGRGYVQDRYSPGADGFWIAFAALALLVLRERLPITLAILNTILLAMMLILTARVDREAIWRPRQDVSISARCVQTILDLPLYRDDSFRKCFYWSDDQSVYHLAALRLSVFRNEKSELILPRADAPVITDLPNRWLSVYVRDYMMAGVASDKLFSIAPLSGTWQPGELPVSPFYRGEWSTDILAKPLAPVWTSPSELVPELVTLAAGQQLIFYLNTPETAANMAVIEPALMKLGFTRSTLQIKSPRYRFARFTLSCFERLGSHACEEGARS